MVAGDAGSRRRRTRGRAGEEEGGEGARGRGGAGARTGGARDGGKKRLSVGEEGPRRALYIQKGL